MDDFTTYRKFIYKDDALDFIKILEQNKIDYELVDNSLRVDSSFGGDINTKQYELKIEKNVFEKVEELEEKLAAEDIKSINQDYYLYEFSDEELIEILMKKDEWNKFDYLAAQKILKERGNEVKPELLNVIRKQRIADLTVQEESPKWLIYIGYFSAIFGGFLGIFIGFYLMKYKKSLPNGEKFYGFSRSDRLNGERILYLSAVGIFFYSAFVFLKNR